ncbi:hypothetical protein [Gemmobacter sp.]|uniref:hypothetical protein n=1 Tax=Gemmobacter sp. TaxID=1898957 RepID=UPI002AFE3EC8|nr:hypothetical protein [Gemmobacter sp.]
MPNPDPFVLSQIRQLIAGDLRAARSDEDLAQRLAAKGYGLRQTDHGRVLTALPHGLEIGPLV